MLSVIEKSEVWGWFDSNWGLDNTRQDLKYIQDTFIMSCIHDVSNKRILEIGGGNSRLLTVFADSNRNNECWNAEKFEGSGGGPSENLNAPEVQIAKCFVGEFDPILKDEYFDIVFSVSVVEHVDVEQLDNFFADAARILKPGGVMYHAIDMYLFDPGLDVPMVRSNQKRLNKYLSFADRPDLGLKMIHPPTVHENLAFSCRFATNPDRTMYSWNRAAPGLKHVREIAQSVSLKGSWIKSTKQNTEMEVTANLTPNQEEIRK